MNFKIEYQGKPAMLQILKVSDAEHHPLGVQVTVFETEEGDDGITAWIADGTIELPDLLNHLTRTNADATS